VEKAETSYESQIQHLEEQLMFLDKHVMEQDKEILNLQKKLDKTAQELKEFRVHFQSGALSTGSADEKPPHY
jgi:uncharacterized coiled-coil protein SlyX